MKFVLKEVRVWGRRAFGCTPVSPGAMRVPPRRSGLPSLDRARRQLVSPPSPAVIIKCTYLSTPHPLPLTAVISRGLEGEKKKKIDKGFQKNTSSAETSHRAAAASHCPWGPCVAFWVGDLGWDCPSRPPEALPWVLWDAARGADDGSPPSSCPARGLAASCPAGSEPVAVCL